MTRITAAKAATIGTLTAAGVLAATLVAEPAAAEDRGCYTASGISAQKNALAGEGGTDLDLAVAMLETSDLRADYTYGDGKTGDSANFGIFKQNWFMIRTSVPQYAGYGPAEYDAGAALNTNLSWDVQVLHASQGQYGMDAWFGGHRNGETGLHDPGTADIANYRNGVYWIQSQIDSHPEYRQDDTRCWVDIPPI